jgi:hypothetical protein
MSFAKYCDPLMASILGPRHGAEYVSNDGSLEEIFEAIVARMGAIPEYSHVAQDPEELIWVNFTVTRSQSYWLLWIKEDGDIVGSEGTFAGGRTSANYSLVIFA